MTVTLLQGDCLAVMRGMEDKTVQRIVTSPPYYGLRDYGTAQWDGGDAECDHKISFIPRNDRRKPGCKLHGTSDEKIDAYQPVYKSICGRCGAIRVDDQIGLEETPDAYVAKLVAVFRECRRVLKDDGTFWLNIADSYASNGERSNNNGEGKSTMGWANQRHDTLNKAAGIKMPAINHGCKPKDLIGIPWMVAFALRADGWYLRSEIIWHKPNPMPESVKDRPTKSHEQIFLLAKSQRYFYDYEAILEPAAFDGRNDTQYKGGDKDMSCGAHERWPVKMPPIGGVKKANGQNRTYSGNTPDYQKMGLNGSGFNGHSGNLDENGESLLYDKDGIPARNKRDVWTVTTKPYKEAHFATFNPDLIEPCILAGSKPGDTVLDPFNGSGTTGAVAIKHGRSYIGIELNEKYITLTEKRLSQVQPVML